MTVPPQEHKDRQDIELDYLRRSNVLVVCGSGIDEAVKNGIAIAERYRIPATTLSGILTVKQCVPYVTDNLGFWIPIKNGGESGI